jgi:hypothetical protein
MNQTRVLPLLFLLVSTAFSQTTGKQPVSQLEQFSSAALQANCPIQLKASLYVIGRTAGVEPIEKGQTTERGQRIHITLANPEAQVDSVRLTLYGLPTGIRAGVSPAVAYRGHEGTAVVHNDPAEIQQTISFDRLLRMGQSSSIDVSVQDFSSVSSIDLNSITYSDGSSWHPANHKYCQAVVLPTGAQRIDGAVAHR